MVSVLTRIIIRGIFKIRKDNQEFEHLEMKNINEIAIIDKVSFKSKTTRMLIIGSIKQNGLDERDEPRKECGSARSRSDFDLNLAKDCSRLSVDHRHGQNHLFGHCSLRCGLSWCCWSVESGCWSQKLHSTLDVECWQLCFQHFDSQSLLNFQLACLESNTM